MDFNALWSRASAAASEVATAAQEQASRAAAAAQEQAELFQGSETFASLERALADIAANTVAVAEQSERNFQAMLADEADKSRARALAESAPRAFGVDEDLEAFVQGLTEETFAAFPLDAADAQVSGEVRVPDASRPSTDGTRREPEPGPTTDAETETETETSRSVVANPWRSTHARLALSKIPKLRLMRDKLVPEIMDDEGFWRAYFALCAPRLAKVEARAAAAVARSRARRANARAAEEQARASAKDDEEDAKRVRDSRDGSSGTAVVGVGGAEGAADAAAALAASFGDDADVLARQEREEEDEDIPPGTPAGDLDAYLNDLLGESSDEDDEDDEDDAAKDAATDATR
jgi:hypothetical protein